VWKVADRPRQVAAEAKKTANPTASHAVTLGWKEEGKGQTRLKGAFQPWRWASCHHESGRVEAKVR